jgi:hypothetical protein
MRFILRRPELASAISLITLPALAHHSMAIYDRERVITIEGTVAEFEWANPHVYLYIEAQNDTRELVLWTFESGPTTLARRNGWSRDTFAPGDRVIATGNPSKDPERLIASLNPTTGGSVTKADESSSSDNSLRDVTSESTRAVATSLSGVWEVDRDQEVFLAFSDPPWSLTERGVDAVASYDDATMNPQLNCIARTAPWVMTFPSVVQIEVGESQVAIRSEYDTVERTIHMSASHDDAPVRHQGHSIGTWEGKVLIVDTTRFGDHRNGNGRGVPSGAQKHLLERFELNRDEMRLTYHFELEDPEYLAEPVVGSVQWAYRPDLDFDSVPCNFENARRFVGD